MKNKYSTLSTITVISILTVSLVVNLVPPRVYATSDETHIPLWLKNVAKWWANGEISDSDFLQGIQYLLTEGIMKIPETKVDSSSSQEIPVWIKIDAKLWSENKIGNYVFVQGIQHLIQTGIVELPKTQAQNQIVPPLGNPKIWFAPLPEQQGYNFVDSQNFTLNGQQLIGSKDFMELFTDGAHWKNAEQHVSVFKLYNSWVLSATDSKLKQTVTYLNNHNITIALETGPLESVSTYCKSIEGFDGKKNTLSTLNRIQEAGGTVRFIALDEPFYYGSIWDGKNACRWSALKVAQQVNTYIKTINLYFPDVVIGDIEPVTKDAGATQYEDWLKTYFAVSGSNLPFFILDTGWSQPNWPMIDKEIETFAHDRKMQVGMIYFGDPNDSSDAEWLSHAEERMITYEAEATGRPDIVIFQSWVKHPSYVLPETSPDTFTHLILSYFKTRTILNITSSQSSDGLQINGNLIQVDGKPLAEAPLQLFIKPTHVSGMFLESDALPVDSGQTDENGNLHFDLKRFTSDAILVKYSGDDNHWPAYLEIQLH